MECLARKARAEAIHRIFIGRCWNRKISMRIKNTVIMRIRDPISIRIDCMGTRRHNYIRRIFFLSLCYAKNK